MQMVYVGLLAYDDVRNLIPCLWCKELRSTHLIVGAFLDFMPHYNHSIFHILKNIPHFTIRRNFIFTHKF